MTEPADRVPALRKAHTAYERYRRAGLPIPFMVRVLDGKYHAQFPRRTGSPAVGAAIRRARRRAGLSRRDLAAAVGVTESAVGGYERADRMPGPETWVQLELTLGPLGVVRERRAVAGDGGQRGEDGERAA